MGVVERVTRAVALDTSGRKDVHSQVSRLLNTESPWTKETDLPRVVNRLTGLGPIQALVDDALVSDVVVNGHDEVWFDRGEGLVRSELMFDSDEDLVATVERVIAPLGLRLDRSAPMVDARLPDGSRLHAVLPPASVDRALVAIRRFTQRVQTLDDLVESGTATRSQIDQLAEAVSAKRTIVVSGGTGAGKTTVLNLLASAFDPSERIVTIEDAAELSFPGHVVRLEARPANAEGVGEITIRDLLRSALRLRPDRIIVGEVRGQEALDLVMALNTGHRGSLTTVHANSPEESMLRLETLALMASNVSADAITRQLKAAVDVVVQIDRFGTQRRIAVVEEIG